MLSTNHKHGKSSLYEWMMFLLTCMYVCKQLLQLAGHLHVGADDSTAQCWPPYTVLLGCRWQAAMVVLRYNELPILRLLWRTSFFKVQLTPYKTRRRHRLHRMPQTPARCACSSWNHVLTWRWSLADTHARQCADAVTAMENGCPICRSYANKHGVASII